MTINYCEGCDTYIYTTRSSAVVTCTAAKYNDKGQCPCVKCVIKMMCTQMCPAYMSFTTFEGRCPTYDY